MVLVNVEEGPLQSEKAASKKFAGKLSQPSVYEVIYRGQTHVRVRLLQWRREPSYAEFLQQLVTKLSGVTDVRFNRSAYSLSVAYDPGLITGDALEAALLDCCETAFTTFWQASRQVSPCISHRRDKPLGIRSSIKRPGGSGYGCLG